VDLYGGTKHSTIRAMRDHFAPSAIQQAVGVYSNKAFERYFGHEYEDQLKIFQKRIDLRNHLQGKGDRKGDKKVTDFGVIEKGK
jgi:hypothetical protein